MRTHPSRRGALIAEAAVALGALAAVTAIAIGVALDRADARRTEARSAAVETAQNLLARIRRGESPALAEGWSVERLPAGIGATAVRVRGPGVAVSTLVAAGRP